jgi:hypothetical protein
MGEWDQAISYPSSALKLLRHNFMVDKIFERFSSLLFL